MIFLTYDYRNWRFSGTEHHTWKEALAELEYWHNKQPVKYEGETQVVYTWKVGKNHISLFKDSLPTYPKSKKKLHSLKELHEIWQSDVRFKKGKK